MNLFRRKRKAKKDIFKEGEFNFKNVDISEPRDFVVSLLYANDMVNTVYPACASCYGISKEKNKTYEEKLAYIGRRVKSHHTSILEHSNVVLQVFIPLTKSKEYLYYTITNHNPNISSQLTDKDNSEQDIMSMISEVRDVCRYLTIVTDYISDRDNNPIMRMTIGGSIRGFRYIFENIRNRNNKLFISIFEVLCRVVPKEFFLDFIEDGVMYEYSTIEIYDSMKRNCPQRLINNINNETIDIINMDDLADVSSILRLDKEDCLDFVSITVDFKRMSRIITQQVTRHRNAITQESQRYVNYSDSVFNSPDKFKEKYNKFVIYHTSLGDFTMEDLGNHIAKVYSELVGQGVEKEDARGFLPQNIQCGNLYMTFTLRTLLVFLDLRLDSHAQAEVNKYANDLAVLTHRYATDFGKMSMKNTANTYAQPLYKRLEEKDDYSDIDEEV